MLKCVTFPRPLALSHHLSFSLPLHTPLFYCLVSLFPLLLPFLFSPFIFTHLPLVSFHLLSPYFLFLSAPPPLLPFSSFSSSSPSLLLFFSSPVPSFICSPHPILLSSSPPAGKFPPSSLFHFLLLCSLSSSHPPPPLHHPSPSSLRC